MPAAARLPLPRRARREAAAAAPQQDLLEWAAANAGFAEEAVRASSLSGRIARAVACVLRDCRLDRDEVAARMSAFLGERVGRSSLDQYASQARADYNISAVRLVALAHATGDTRLLGLLLDPFGLTPVPKHALDLLRVQEQLKALRAREAELLRAVGGEGR